MKTPMNKKADPEDPFEDQSEGAEGELSEPKGTMKGKPHPKPPQMSGTPDQKKKRRGAVIAKLMGSKPGPQY